MCRYDALCNVVGKQFITVDGFYKKCDEYDKKYNITNQFSRTYFSVFNDNGQFDNIFNHILCQQKYHTTYLEVDSLSASELNECSGFIAFSDNHTWAVRRSKDNPNVWIELDGKAKKIHPGNTMSFRGAILIYPNVLVEDKSIEKPLSRTQIKKMRRETRKQNK